MAVPKPIPLLIDVESGKRYELGEVFTIGRSQTCDLVIDSRRVSRQHAMIKEDGDGHLFFDLDSANGSWVDGAQVEKPVHLSEGSQIRIASQGYTFYTGATSVSASVQADPPPDATMVLIDHQPMTFLVADIHRFTTLSEGMEERAIADMLGQWYSRCRLHLDEAGGTIDKFIGDSVFAYWRDTSAQTRLAASKCATAISASLNGLEGLDGGSCGVGLHIGSAAVGAIGGGNRTALGEAVNLTFRVEGLTRALGRSVLATHGFIEDWQEGLAHFEAFGQHAVKGFSREIRVYAPAPRGE